MTETEFDRLAVAFLREVIFDEELAATEAPGGFLYQSHPAFVLAWQVYGITATGPVFMGMN